MSLGPHLICMLPMAGCAEILDARSSVEEDEVGCVEASRDPGGGRVEAEVEVMGRTGRRAVRSDIERRWASDVDVRVLGRATRRKQRKAFILSPTKSTCILYSSPPLPMCMWRLVW